MEKKEPSRDEKIDLTLSKLSGFNYGKKLLNKKRKKKKERKTLLNPTENALSLIAYEKYTKYDDIKSALQSNVPALSTKDNIEFVQQLLASKIYNVNININDILGGRCFNLYLGKFGYVYNESYIFTSDNLYWIANLYELLKKKDEKERKIRGEEKEEKEEGKDNLSLINLVNMKEKYINIQAIDSRNASYRKGYINDRNKDFSIIGFEHFSPEDQGKIKNGEIPGGATEGTFAIRGTQYKYYIYSKGECIIMKIPDEKKDENLQTALSNYMKEYNIIGSKKMKGDSFQIKLYTLDNGNIYISQKVKLSDYWPCEVIFPNPLSYSFLYKFDVDMIRYEQFILKNYLEYANKGELNLEKFFVFDNIIDFSNFNLMINFLTVEILANFDANTYKDLNAKYFEFIAAWKKCRNAFNIVKRNMSYFLKLFDSFFCSFRDKISYKVFVRINKLISKRINEFKSSFNDLGGEEEGKNVYDVLMDFLLTYKLERVACTVFNACEKAKQLHSLAQDIGELASKVVNLNAKSIFKDMQEIGFAIYSLYISEEDDVTHVINEIRSPSLYLGDLILGNSAVAKGIMDKFKENVNEDVEVSKYKTDDFVTMTKIGATDAIKLAIGDYFKTKGGLKDVYKLSGKEVKLQGDYAAWFKTLDSVSGKKGTPELEAYGRTIFVGPDFVRNNDLLPTVTKELETLLEGYKKYKKVLDDEAKADKSKKEYKKVETEIKENLSEIDKKEEKEKEIEKDEKDEKDEKEDEEETKSTRIETINDFDKLEEGKEKDNYVNLISAGYTKEEILKFIGNNEKLLVDDSAVDIIIDAKKAKGKSKSKTTKKK